MNILITGGTGLVGYNLQKRAPKHYSILSIYDPAEYPLSDPLPFPSEPVDIINFPALTQLFSHLRPNVVIHTAAQGNLDWVETNKSEATLINTTASIHLAKLCHAHHSHFIFLSSNAIYDGEHPPYTETDQPSPQNHYGSSKVTVERWLSSSSSLYTIIRPTLLYGWPSPNGRDNQVTRVIKNLSSHQHTNAVYDTWFNPLFVESLVNVIWHIATNQITGDFNIAGADRLNLFQLSTLTAAIFSLDSSYLKPVSVSIPQPLPNALLILRFQPTR